MAPRWKKLRRKLNPSTDVIRDRLQQIEGATLSHAHKFIVRRWKNLREVRKYAFAWLVVIGALIAAGFWQTFDLQKLYTSPVAVRGGTYTEGVVGGLDNINPIYASTQAERSVSRLLFSGLLTYNERNQLVGELADSWKVDSTGREYTLSLRPNLRWHDDKPITARDVVYTIATIKNADAKSPLYASWRAIVVEQTGERTVKFILPVPYAPFLNALTVGILPEHQLGQVRPAELRNNGFNRSPVTGSGPFKFSDLRNIDPENEHSVATLTANEDYHNGAPRLDRFILHGYKEREQLLKAFQTQEISALADTNTQELPKAAQQTTAPLYNGVFAFFKLGNPLLQDAKIRQALQLATDQDAMIKRLDGMASPLRGPLLPEQITGPEQLAQPTLNLAKAEQLLDAAGWKRDSKTNKRMRDGQPLRLQVVTANSGDYPAVAEELAKQWSKLGIEASSPQLAKLEDFQQAVILPRAYDVLVYELAIGHDPDVYAYWHSTQAVAKGLNLSEYKSPKVDDALDTGRTRLDGSLREAKYRTFVQQWLVDVPAVALYRPNLIYLSNQNITSFDKHPIVEPIDRYSNVIYWSANKEPLRATR